MGGGREGRGGERKVEESAAGNGTSNEEQPHFAGAGEGKDSFDHLYPVMYALLQGELRGCRGMEQRGAFLVSQALVHGTRTLYTRDSSIFLRFPPSKPR